MLAIRKLIYEQIYQRKQLTMQLHQIKPTHKKKRGRRVGRGGKRGTYSGRGVKGQKSRSGRRFKPAVRYLIKRYPKLRGYRFSVSGLKFQTVNLDSLDKSFEPGQTVNPQTLLEKKIVRKINGRVPDVKILGGGKIKDFFNRKPLEFSEEQLIQLMRDRSEEQRKIFMDRIAAAKDLLAKNPNDTDALEIIGFLHDTLGDKETAQKYYKEVLRLNPESVPALNNLANIYRDREDFSGAEKLYLKITEVEASNIEAWRDLHDLYRYLYKSKEDQADDILLSGLEKNPDDPQILAMLATYYQDTGDKEKAIEYYERLVKAMPENEAAKNELKKLRGY